MTSIREINLRAWKTCGKWLTPFVIMTAILSALWSGSANASGVATSDASPTASEVGEPLGATSLYVSPNERFGVGPVQRAIDSYDVSALGAGWYHAWTADQDAPHPAQMEAVHLVRTTPAGLSINADRVELVVQQDPGAVWLIGNEPDMIRQDNVTPEQYAEQYHDAYFLIKQADPSAQVAAGGIVQPTPLRLGWLTAAWDAYQEKYGAPMPADAWQFHNYILQEAPGEWGADIPPGYYEKRGATYPANEHDSLVIFQEHTRAMRAWMAERGQQQKPLYLTEFGILFPESSGFDFSRVKRFFQDTTNWMLTASDPALGYAADGNHLVQSWLWYSLDDTHFADGDNTVAALFDPNTHNMRPMGAVFAAQALPLRRPYINLAVARVDIKPVDGSPLSLQKSQPVTVQALIKNRGNAPASKSFRVVATDNQGQVVHTEDVPGMPARYDGDLLITFAWQKPAGLDWKLQVVVDADQVITESDETDNAGRAGPTADLNLGAFTARNAQGVLATTWRAGSAMVLAAEVTQVSGSPVSGATVRFWDEDVLLHTEVLPAMALGDKREITYVWATASAELHNLSADVSMPTGVDDPVTENNLVAMDLLVSSYQVHFPALYSGVSAKGPACEKAALANPSFESGGMAPWQASIYINLANQGCFDGDYCAAMGRGLGIDDALSQIVSIPSGSSAQLDFAWVMITAEPNTAARDTLTVEIRSKSGQLLDTLKSLDNRDARPAWQTVSLNLDAYAGQTVQVHLRTHNDSINRTSFFVDDFALETCSTG